MNLVSSRAIGFNQHQQVIRHLSASRPTLQYPTRIETSKDFQALLARNQSVFASPQEKELTGNQAYLATRTMHPQLSNLRFIGMSGTQTNTLHLLNDRIKWLAPADKKTKLTMPNQLGEGFYTSQEKPHAIDVALYFGLASHIDNGDKNNGVSILRVYAPEYFTFKTVEEMYWYDTPSLKALGKDVDVLSADIVNFSTLSQYKVEVGSIQHLRTVLEATIPQGTAAFKDLENFQTEFYDRFVDGHLLPK